MEEKKDRKMKGNKDINVEKGNKDKRCGRAEVNGVKERQMYTGRKRDKGKKQRQKCGERKERQKAWKSGVKWSKRKLDVWRI